ncbi:MAG: bifunctional folylpolyglutamate synthase/dihydrofolate synthase, partial [Candidatus Sumerlaeia bacterium]|nr:bifunctional folylpolyglutamate synthase/dihydrofolate synthase [Candidatus Sumerlaeia bacterium]
LRSNTQNLIEFANFVERLGNPQQRLKLIHIAGTKGKGSTGSLLASVLHSAGYRTGFYCSPHIYSYRERIQIDGNWISEEDFAHIITELKQHWHNVGSPSARSFRTVFELLTAGAFLYFLKKQVDVAVIETGLGGRLDATNIIKPLLSIITTIGFDHKYLLGDTISEIAKEKAGIIKQGVPVVLAQQNFSTATECIVQKALSEQCPVYFAEEEIKIIERKTKLTSQQIKIQMQDRILEIETKMLGLHQARNIQTVLTAVSILKKLGFNIQDTAIVSGIQKWYIPGRFELISTEPLIVVDGAHCPLSIEALMKTVYEMKSALRLIILLSLMLDKEVAEILAVLKQYASESMVITYPAPTPRTMSAEKLALLAQTAGLKAQPFPSLAPAINYSINLLKKGEFNGLICCGTFYSIANLKQIFSQLLTEKID